LAATTILFTLVSAVSASTWKIDTDHSAANFSIKHMAISKVKGSFDKINGQLEFHESGPNPFSLELTIDPASIDTGVTKRDEHLRSADFFDVEHHPTITFVSEKVTLTGNGAYQVEGSLDMHGVSKKVTVFLEGLVAEEKDPWGNIRRGALLTGDIKRKDFGIVYNSVLENGNLLIGEIADVNVDLQFIKN
jgi:polyisoprenoid-binding protein YceI